MSVSSGASNVQAPDPLHLHPHAHHPGDRSPCSPSSHAGSNGSGPSGDPNAPQSVFYHYPHCGGSIPTARWAHGAAAVGHKLLIYGGVGAQVFDDLHVLDTHTMVWRTATPTALRPKERPGKRLCPGIAASGNLLWLLSGQHGRKYVRDLFSLNTDTLQWQQHHCANLPSARAGHSLTHARDTLFVFGGQGKKFLNDLHAMHVPTLQWHELTPAGRAPSPRRGHSLTFNGTSQLVLFGGSSATSTDNAVHVYCLDTNTWLAPTIRGTPPAPRTQHTATFVSPHMLLVFGGCNAAGNFFNDVHLLDTRTFTWLRPQVLGAAPAPRYHHSCTMVEGKMLLYGGINSKQMFEGVVLVETKFNEDISHVAEELFKMSGRPGAGGAESSLAADMVKVQLQGLLMRRNMEEQNMQVSQRVEQAQEQLGRTKEEKDGLAVEVAQLRLMLAEAEDARTRLAAQCSDLEGRLQREATAAEAARLKMEQAQAEAGSLSAQLAEAREAQEGLEKELGIVASRYARTKLERDALLAGRSTRRRTTSDAATASAAGGGSAAAATAAGAAGAAPAAVATQTSLDVGAAAAGSAASDQAAASGASDASSSGSLSVSRESLSPSPDGEAAAAAAAAAPRLRWQGAGPGPSGGSGGGAIAQPVGPGAPLPALWATSSAAGTVAAAAGALGEVRAARLQEEEAARLRVQLARLQGDRSALAACSLAELREIVDVVDVAGRVVRDVMIDKTVEEAQQRAAGSGEHHCCSLCMEAPRAVAFNCGHQSCEQCSLRLVACPFCRADITAKIRLFDT